MKSETIRRHGSDATGADHENPDMAAARRAEEKYQHDRILNMMSTSEAHNLRNAGLTHGEHWKRVKDWVELIHDNGMKINGCVSTIWGCPIKGPMPMNLGWEFAERFLEAGADDIEHADHDGQATPDSVYRYFCRGTGENA